MSTLKEENLKMDIKEEVELEIKSENVQQSEPEPESENTFDNINIIIKEEHNIDSINDDTIENNESKSDFDLKSTKIPIGTVYSTQIDIKEEINMDESEVSYDYPNFDNTSLNSVEGDKSVDSSDMNILSNVEACLQEEINIKYENDCPEDNEKPDYHQTEMKTEPHDTHLAENHRDELSDGMTKNVIVKLPPEHMGNNEELLAERNSHLIEKSHDLQEQFQLNSITGNELSLEQEAYGLTVVSKKQSVVQKYFKCTECAKIYRKKCDLKRHTEVHRTIERRQMGVLQGLATRKANKIRRDSEMQHYETYDGVSDDSGINQRKEGYKCTCGKVFKRRSTMETCLRSHNLSESESTCISCVTCTKSFQSKTELALHRKRLHRKKFPCKFCPTDYETRKELFKHLQIHQKVQLMEYKVISEVMKGKQKLQCFMCSKAYSEISELKLHVLNDHKQPYRCPHCLNTFTKIVDFGNHTKSYHPEVKGQSVLDVLEAFSKLVKSWKCDECDLQFLDADKLALHQIELHNPDLKAEPQFQCTDCRRVFVSQKGLTSHRRVHHTVENPEETKEVEQGIMCLECRKFCKDMEALTSHMRLHSPDRKYPCKFCDFRFATPEKRKAHAEIHTGDMKFVCFICEYQCSSENRLKKHKMSLKHANMKEYLLTGKPLVEEPQTSNGESSEKKRKRDRERSDSEKKRERKSESSDSDSEVPCDICGEKFVSESLMLEHKQVHPFIEFPNDDKPSRIFFK